MATLAPVQPAELEPRRLIDAGTGVGWSNRRLFGVVFGVLFVLYLATSSLVFLRTIDASTNAITSWSLVRHGTPVAVGFEGLEAPDGASVPHSPWIVASDRGPMSQYPPGTALLATPFYGLASLLGADDQMVALPLPDGSGTQEAPLPAAWIGAVAGAAITAAAAGVIALSVALRSGSRIGMIAAGVFGLATSAWLVAGTNLWQHGASMLWLSLGVYLTQRERHLSSGLAFGFAILTRPHTAIIAAAVGIAAGWSKRSLKPTLAVGVLSAAGLGALLFFNYWAFGSLSISGGYSEGFSDRATDMGSSELLRYVKNIGGGLFNPQRGLLTFAPYLLVLLPGLREGWRRLDMIGRGAAIGGILYLLVQWKANRFSGGDSFWSYRYPLEMLAVTVLLGVASWEALAGRERLRQIFGWMVGFAIAMQMVGVVVV